MKISELVSHIAKKEAGKSNVKIGDIREIVGIISDLIFKDQQIGNNETTYLTLHKSGKRRSKKKIVKPVSKKK